MERNELFAIVAICLGVVSVVIGPTYIVNHNSTERLTSCIESGGEYLMVPNTSKMECQR